MVETPFNETSPFLGLPYAERQHIVIADDAVLQAKREAEAKPSKSVLRFNWQEILTAVTLGPVGWVALEGLRRVAKARESGLPVLTIRRSEAQDLTLPPGHPRNRVLYVGHPADPKVYYPAAGFHRFTFEHKFVEAIRLLMSLRASELEVEHVRGWSEEFAAELAVPIAGVEVGGGAGRKKSSGSRALFRGKLRGSGRPTIPDGLAWYPHEPTWKQVAEGRIQYGLKEFQLAVRYDDDYGIDADFKLMVEKVGLKLGGTFQAHEATQWTINGTFGSTAKASAH